MNVRTIRKDLGKSMSALLMKSSHVEMTFSGKQGKVSSFLRIKL